MNSLNSDEDLASKCIGLCHALASKNKSFSFSLTVGSNFSFSLDTREMVSDNQTKKAKKKREKFKIEDIISIKANLNKTFTKGIFRSAKKLEFIPMGIAKQTTKDQLAATNQSMNMKLLKKPGTLEFR